MLTELLALLKKQNIDLSSIRTLDKTFFHPSLKNGNSNQFTR